MDEAIKALEHELTFRTHQRDELLFALQKVRAHTSYINPTLELLQGLLQTIERIADKAIATANPEAQ